MYVLFYHFVPCMCVLSLFELLAQVAEDAQDALQEDAQDSHQQDARDAHLEDAQDAHLEDAQGAHQVERQVLVLGLDEVETLGQRLGQSVQRVVDIAAWQVVSGPISIAQHTLTLHTEPTKQNILQAAAATAQKYVREWAEYHLDLERNGEKASTEIEFEIQTIRFGQSLLIITMAGEMSVEYSLGFKYEWSEHFDQVWPLGYTNNIVGYVPVQRQIPEGGYEVVDNNRYQLYTGPFVEKTEAQIRAAVRKNLTTDQACLH